MAADCIRHANPQHRVRLALHVLDKGKGGIAALQRPLEGFNRFRIGGLRVIYRQISGKEILFEFANTCEAVHELYEHVLKNRKP